MTIIRTNGGRPGTFSGREIQRRARRALFEAAARDWSGTREALRRAVREAMKPWRRRFGLLARILRDARFAAAVAAAVLAGGAMPALASPPIELSTIAGGTGGFVINGKDFDDASGRVVASAGDVNGDGLADLIVSANNGESASINEGESYVVFGKAGGSAVEISDIVGGTGGFVIIGIDANDNSGYWVSGAGDVNGDGLADLLVGASDADPGGDSNAGECYVVFGKATTSAVELSDVVLGTGGFAILGIAPNDALGHCLSVAGDVNGDGLADLLVAAPFADPGSTSNAGKTFLVFGKTDGTTVDLANVETGSGGFVINGIDVNDAAGAAVSGAGDVNGDGLADLLVGARGGDPGGDSNAGETYVIFGKTSGTAVALSSVASGSGGFVINGIDADDLSGYSVSGAGDVNGDGLSDLIVGAYRADPAGDSSAGESYVVFGKSGGTAVELSDVAAGTGGFAINGIDADDLSGTRVSSAGDVNGDGLSDVIIGAHFADPGGDSEAGEGYVVFGKSNGTTVELSDVAAGTGGFMLNGIDPGDRAGVGVSGAGDVNGDGLVDVIVGANWADPGGDSFAGESYVIFSPETAPASATYLARTIIGDGVGGAIVPVTELKDARVKINFSDDDNGSASGSASTETVTITRSDSGISLVPAADVANVHWEITSNRTGWTSAELTFKYTDAEIAGMTEGNVKVFQASSIGGVWTELPTTLDAARNEAKATVTGFSFFALAEAGTVPVELSGFAVE